MHFHFQPKWFAFVLHNGIQLAKSGPTKAYSASQLLFLIMVFCHYLSEVDVAVDFFNLPSMMLMSVFLTTELHMTLVFPQVHIETYWFAGFMDVL